MMQNKKKWGLLNFYTGTYKSIFRIVSCVILIATSIQVKAQIDLDFSKERGFSDVAFDLTINSTEPTATIRYTLDGEEPSTTAGEIYSGSISITTTTVLRAIGYVIGQDTSKVYTHTYLFLDDVIEQPANIAGWPNDSYDIGSGTATAVHDYEMDPDIVDAPAYSADLMQGLKDIPSMSIVMPYDDFWNMYNGNSEKKTSIELLYADDPSKNEQEDGGIEPHSHDRLKRSMRLSFKKIYGAANWDSDIFRNAAVGSETAENEFDRIVLRAGNNRAWSRNWNTDRTAFTRDEWYRQSQIASSGIGSHGTFVHLYVNGLYWGLYNPVERPDEAFSSTYLGGEKEDWFAVSHGGDQGGNDDRYDYMMGSLLNKDMTQAINYQELQEYLDINKFSDYLLISWMTGVQDWPGNNWWGGNRNNPSGPFMYYGWDCEWSWDVTFNANNGAWVHPAFRSNNNGGNASARVFNKSKVNDDFMMSFADRAYKLCFNDGAMTDDNSRTRWSNLNNHIKNAVVAESARWGDGINDGTTRTRDVHWQDEVDRLDGLMDGNVDRLITALRNEGYYPTIDPPLYENNGVTLEIQKMDVSAGYTIDLVNPNSNGDIYYTTNGNDPRMSGGAVDPSATLYTNQDIIFNSSTNFMARVKVGNEWSVLHCLNVIVAADLSPLKLTEIMYNPEDFGAVEGGELEFLEIKNTSTTLTLDLSGVQITDGVDYTFPLGTTMPPQSFLVLASNATELSAKCPGASIFGEYEGALSNGGERIDFTTSAGDTIIRVEYDDKSPWPVEADGDGYALVPVENNPIGSQDNAALWRLSDNNTCGSPGEDDPGCIDSDDDGVCDDLDLCPGFDDALIGTFCDDGDATTVNDVYTTACTCQGIPIENSDLSWLKLTEIMYNPEDFGAVDGGELEFLEIKNTSNTLTLDISLLEITDGVNFTFPFGTTMAPQSFIVIASNASELSAKCPDVTVFGEYDGALSNGGEMIELVSLAGDTLIRVEYDDAMPWPVEADGDGYSLVPTERDPVGSQNDAALWKLSGDDLCGSPGEDDCYGDLEGMSCDDNNPNTIDDVYDINCECRGRASSNPLLEAEDAIVGSAWTIESDAQACGSEYALPPDMTELVMTPSLPDDYITFTFNVDVTGTYKVYARTMTTSDDDDSFWIRANGGTWYPWDKINFGNYGNFYQWSQLGNWTDGNNVTPLAFEFTAGSNTVDFAWREPGARLDKIFVTNEDLSVLNQVRNNDSSGEFSFRYTVQEACPSDTIYFATSTDATSIVVDNDLINIDRTLTIIGNGPSQTVLSGDGQYQLFTNALSNILSIHKLKMINGFAPVDGGAFVNNGILFLEEDVELEGNMEGNIPKAFTNNNTLTIGENSEVIIKE